MIFANSYPYLYPYEYCPKLLRLFFSSAAPVFIFLSGVSLRLAQENGKELRALIIRAFQILFFAIIIDVLIWSIVPFFTMDVLYLISFSLLITISILSFSDKVKLIVAIVFIILTTATKSYYNFELKELPIESFFSENLLYPSLHHVFIDGWFPVIPWSGFTVFGYLVCKNRVTLSKHSKYILSSGIILILVFSILYSNAVVSANPLRNGYTEIFYPVSAAYLLYVFGLFLVITFLLNYNSTGFGLVGLIGKFSLPIYFIHIFLIKYYLPLFFQSTDDFNKYFFLFGVSTFYLLIFLFLAVMRIVEPEIKSKKKRCVAFLLGL
jgi:hypothetical protein